MLEIETSIPFPAWANALPEVEDLVRSAAQAALDAALTARVPAHGPRLEGELSLILTDDAEVAGLNQTWRDKAGPTNVLSFPGLEPDEIADAEPGRPLLLGDVVVAFETTAREAVEQGKPLADHLRHLVVHGVLHLFGYDHLTEDEAGIMEPLETAVLSSLGVPDPYAEGDAQ
ncbi:rRNA maturation RNase YbeY [Zavarzinia sp. CC-PAN008]|uniref:rRNA maturation RNase YbeY n=1 Tax=Zavarzinia sp. CC-PAN008 TaxID=3243332 RepID=UPI003F749EB2